jgi:hypothetical protein
MNIDSNRDIERWSTASTRATLRGGERTCTICGRVRRRWAPCLTTCAPLQCQPRVTDPTQSFENASVAALLAKRSREDRAALLDELVAVLSEVVPGVQVERALLRRNITSVRLPVGDFVYVLARGANDSFEASRQQEVRGVVIRTVPMAIDLFLAELGLALDVELRRSESGRKALEEWLKSS